MVNRFFDWLFTIPQWIGFTGAILFGVIYYMGSLVFGYSIAVGWLWLFLVIGGLVSGLRSSIILSVLISIYTFLTLVDPSRMIQGVCITLLSGLLVGYYHRYQVYQNDQRLAVWQLARQNEDAAKVLIDLNGNLDKVHQSRMDILNVIEVIDLPDSAKKQLGQTVHTLGNLEQSVSGWMALYKIRDSVLDDKLAIGEKIRRSGRNPLGPGPGLDAG